MQELQAGVFASVLTLPRILDPEQARVSAERGRKDVSSLFASS